MSSIPVMSAQRPGNILISQVVRKTPTARSTNGASRQREICPFNDARSAGLARMVRSYFVGNGDFGQSARARRTVAWAGTSGMTAMGSGW